MPWYSPVTGQKLANEPHHGHLIGVHVRVFLAARIAVDLDRRREQNHAEYQERGGELLDQGGAKDDEDAAQNERTNHTDEQHPLLQRPWHGERPDDHDEDKEVVYREALLHQVPGVVLHANVAAVLRPHPHAKDERQRDVEDGPTNGLFHRHLMRLARDDEVDGQQQHHADERDRPQLRSADCAEFSHGSPQILDLRSPSPSHMDLAPVREACAS